ncbi:MAG: Electron transport complex subunit RsxB [Phycisphaerae bacterium]|nr:Electron transport complex subunit RsxB [Phycisphaerae bacterium]
MTRFSYSIMGGDYENGGSASRAVKAQLQRAGVDPATIRRAMIACYEAEMNVVIHARQGQLHAEIEDGLLRVAIEDQGPGIADINLAMQEGYSTADAQAREHGFGAGLGLPNIRRNSEQLQIESVVGQGTTVTFAVRLKSAQLYGNVRHSIRIDAASCQQCHSCVRACPTQAIRAFHRAPEILSYRCIDCTECIAHCPSQALHMASTTWDVRAPRTTRLVVPPEFLAQFYGRHTPQQVHQELVQMGWQDIVLTNSWLEALRYATHELAEQQQFIQPLLTPVCPAVMNLIAWRYPALLAYLTPYQTIWETISATYSAERITCVVMCPAQQSLLTAPEHSQVETISAIDLRDELLSRLPDESPITSLPANRKHTHPSSNQELTITGVQAVMAVLDALECGELSDVAMLELWACSQGCFGTPLALGEGHILNYRWQLRSQASVVLAGVRSRQQPLQPRTGMRLDDDMQQAVVKLARIDQLRESLPGFDCAECGAPSCAALAEDIVLGRARLENCRHQKKNAEEHA